MAIKQYYATGAFKYGTRRLTAGDPIELDDPSARLFNALGKITERKPRAPQAPAVDDAPKPRRRRKATAKK